MKWQHIAYQIYGAVRALFSLQFRQSWQKSKAPTVMYLCLLWSLMCGCFTYIGTHCTCVKLAKETFRSWPGHCVTTKVVVRRDAPTGCFGAEQKSSLQQLIDYPCSPFMQTKRRGLALESACFQQPSFIWIICVDYPLRGEDPHTAFNWGRGSGAVDYANSADTAYHLLLFCTWKAILSVNIGLFVGHTISFTSLFTHFKMPNSACLYCRTASKK